MNISEYTANAFLFLITGGPIIIISIIILIIIQSLRLNKKLDPYLFNSKNFNELELTIYNQFPLVTWKVLAYVRAIVFPKTMIKRFGSFDVKYHVTKLDIFTAYLTILAIAIFIITIINAITSVIMLYLSNG